MCDFLRNCINKCLEFQIGFLIKFHQILNPNLNDLEEFNEEIPLNDIIDEQPKIVDGDGLHNFKEKDPNLKIEIHEMSMEDKTISDLKAIEEIRKCYENSFKGKIRKRIVKNNRKPLKTIDELQEFSSEMVLDEEKDEILHEKEVWNKTGIC